MLDPILEKIVSRYTVSLEKIKSPSDFSKSRSLRQELQIKTTDKRSIIFDILMKFDFINVKL